MDIAYLESQLNKLARRVTELEDLVAQLRRGVEHTQDDVRRVDDRLRYVEADR